MIYRIETAEGYLGYDEEEYRTLYVYLVLIGEKIWFHLWELIAR